MNLVEDWYSLLPPALLQGAFRAGNELAWPKEAALRVIDLLTSKGYRILSVEPWLPTSPGPTPLTYDWPLRGISSGKQKSAKEFIETFKHPVYNDDLEPVFNISAKQKE